MTTSKSPLGEFIIPIFSIKPNGNSGSSKSARIFSIALTCGEIIGGISVAVEIGSGVIVDGMGDGVSVSKIGEEVTIGAHPLFKTDRNISARNNEPAVFFMILSLLISLCKTAPN